MAKSKTTPEKTAALPGMSGPGVAPLNIPAITKAVTKYERAKEKRCQASPAEISAKQELQAALHEHADKLPKNDDGFRFYRLDDVDYILEETMKRKRTSSGDSAGGEE